MQSQLPLFPILRPPQKQHDQSKQGVSSLKYDAILQDSFIYLLVGKPGCGKSHLIHQFIFNPDLYFQKFHKIVYISPSRVHPDIQFDDQFNAQYLDQEHIISVLERLTQIAQKKPQRRCNFLFVLDDCVAALKNISKTSILTNLFFNRRHIVPNANISIIVTTQQFQAVCTQIRSVTTALYLFNPTPKQLDILQAQYVFDKDMCQQMARIIQYYFAQDKHEFIYIQLYPQCQLYYNFLKVF